MSSLTGRLAQYAEYHRDIRNIISHIVGIPIIVVAVTTLLSRPEIGVVDFGVSPALIVAAAMAIFYLRMDACYGLAMAIFLALCVWVGHVLSAQSTTTWLVSGFIMFFVGWTIQFVGHFYEGRKPAFLDDVIGLLIGPLFVVAELGFMLGLRSDIRHAIEARAGIVRSRADNIRA